MRYLRNALLLLLVLLAAAWLAFPWLATGLAPIFLPANWSLLELEVGRPGWVGIEAGTVRLQGQVVGQDVQVAARDARFEYRGQALAIDEVELEVAWMTGLGGGGFPALHELAVPRLLMAPGLPGLRIGRLAVRADGLPVSPLVLEDLDLARGAAGEARLETHFPTLPALNTGAWLRLDWGRERLFMRLEFGSEPGSHLQLVQEPGAALTTRVQARLNLSDFEAVALQGALAQAGWPGAVQANGVLQLEAHFEGPAMQSLRTARLDLDAVRIDGPGDSRLALSADFDARLDGPAARLTARRAVEVEYTGRAPDWPSWLVDAAGELGLSPALGDGSRLELGLQLPPAAVVDLGLQAFRLERVRAGVDWNLFLAGASQVELGDARLQGVDLSIAGTGTLELHGGALQGLQSDAVALGFGALEFRPADGVLGLHAERGELVTALAFTGVERHWSAAGSGQLEGVVLPGAEVVAQALFVDWSGFDPAALSGGLSIATSGLALTVDGQPRRGLEVEARIDLDGTGAVVADGAVAFGAGASLPFTLVGGLDQGRYTASIPEATLDAADFAALLGPLGLTYPEGLEVSGGHVRIGGDAEWADALRGRVRVSGEAVVAGYAESGLEGIDFELDVRWEDAVTLAGQASVRTVLLAAGLDVDAVSSRVDFHGGGPLLLRSGAGRLWDGRLAFDELRWGGAGLEPVTLDWQGFDLARLVAFADIGGLQASGTLDAQLPLRQAGEGIAIDGGRFEARAPGRIAYRGPSPAGNIGMRALEDFHYETLEGTIGYDPEGPYEVRIEMLGRNPDLYGGHPVLFRLNLAGEMPAMFRSLFLTGSFHEAILEQLRVSPETQP